MPLAVSLYNQTMGGVDLGDQLIQEYSPDMRQLKMWKRILWNGLTTAAGKKFAAFSFLFCFCNPINKPIPTLKCKTVQMYSVCIAVNAYIVYRDQGNTSSRLRFMHAVCTGLIGTYRQHRQRVGRPSAGTKHKTSAISSSYFPLCSFVALIYNLTLTKKDCFLWIEYKILHILACTSVMQGLSLLA